MDIKNTTTVDLEAAREVARQQYQAFEDQVNDGSRKAPRRWQNRHLKLVGTLPDGQLLYLHATKGYRVHKEPIRKVR